MVAAPPIQPDHRRPPSLRARYQARPDLWEERAHYLALADETYRPWLTIRWRDARHLASLADLAVEHFVVPSARRGVPDHTVVFDAAREMGPARWTCDCPARTYGNPCRHIGAGIHYVRTMAKSFEEAAQVSQRRYEDFCDWLETRGW